MRSEVAISVAGVSKYYRVAQNREVSATAAEALLKKISHPLTRTVFDEFRALDDVSFEVPHGEALGIVGRNGAGKSTLLKLLTRIAAPTKGRIEVAGRIGSLLEVGTGFHPELTGRENVYLNGTLLGMRRKEIDRRFDEIVDFSGVERFLETQVKRFSTGMYIRLAFAVAAHLETEILAVDEVLAVGDADFQNKCLDKMRRVTKDGRTVLLVSHQVGSVRDLCTSAIYLEAGKLIPTESVDDAIEHYTTSFKRALTSVEVSRRTGTGELRIESVKPSKDVFSPDEPKEFRISVPRNDSWPGPYFLSAHVVDEHGRVVSQCDSRLVNFWPNAAEPVEAALTIGTPWLQPGGYTLDVFLCRAGILDSWEGACAFQVLDDLPYPRSSNEETVAHGLVLADFDYRQC